MEPPTISWEPPFWYTTTNNNLYGLQIGADGKLFDWGRFSIDGLVKTGIYDNNADEITAVSVVHKQVRSASASTNHGAFAGEAGLLCEYQLAKGLLLKAGYEVMLLEGVALRLDKFRKPMSLLRQKPCRRWASIATPARFITEPPWAWNTRFRSLRPAQARRRLKIEDTR